MQKTVRKNGQTVQNIVLNRKVKKLVHMNKRKANEDRRREIKEE